MKSDFILKDTRQIKRMKDHSLLWVYSCSGEIYKLLSLKTLHELVKKIKKGKIDLKSNLLYGRKYITLEENFISILDKYIGYIRDTYTIKHNELILLIEETLKNNYTRCLYMKFDYHENYDIFILDFKRMFLANLIYNTKYYAKQDKDKRFSEIQKANNFLKDKSIAEKKDLKIIEDYFIKVISNRKDNLYNLFIPHSEIKKRDLDFYMHQVNWIYEDYYKRNESIFKN